MTTLQKSINEAACSPQDINTMREWIADCYWNDLDDVYELTDFEVLAGVERHYDGGIKQFIQDNS